ncbi:hypothetical protein [Arthrobacter sp. efr-133-TYG-118]|uniref:hypothetical protein n=1 Tax=Arthrobacter sp. efr-133-TYG-118 TaxID=3040279 RepID=UPI00254D287C|nr:hypothetical protein [Arthrobacter sp. efr-133-TYG-118]
MTFPDQLLGLQEVGSEVQPYWAVGSPDGSRLQLEAGESVQFTCSCQVSGLKPASWKLPDGTTLIVTDRRIAFLTMDFDKGGGWVGLGAVGLAVALTANAVSKARAKRRSAGLVAIGNIRHEWIESVVLREQKPLIGGADHYIDIMVRTSRGLAGIELWSGRSVVVPKLALWLAAMIAWHRASISVPFTVAERFELERLKSLAERGVTIPAGSFTLQIPGNVEASITAIQANER